MDIPVQHPHIALGREQPLSEGGTPHVDRVDARLPIGRSFVEQPAKPALEREQTSAGGILRDAVKLFDHLRDDPGCIFILTTLD